MVHESARRMHWPPHRSGLLSQRRIFLYLMRTRRNETLMKKIFASVATVVALCATFNVQARSLEAIQKAGSITMGSEGQYAPFNFFKGN